MGEHNKGHESKLTEDERKKGGKHTHVDQSSKKDERGSNLSQDDRRKKGDFEHHKGFERK